MKCGESNTNSPELSLLKFLPLAYHYSYFLVATLDFTFFFHNGLFGATHFFLQLGCFGLDYKVHVDKWESTVHDDCLTSLRDGGAVSLCWDGVVGQSLVV